jgi:hypothetical protein
MSTFIYNGADKEVRYYECKIREVDIMRSIGIKILFLFLWILLVNITVKSPINAAETVESIQTAYEHFLSIRIRYMPRKRRPSWLPFIEGGLILGLNKYRDEAGEFINRIGINEGFIPKIFEMLAEEMNLLKESREEPDKFRHQVYDMLFILFEIASIYQMESRTGMGQRASKKVKEIYQ